MLQLNLTPEDIDTLVKDSILKSGIGKAIEGAVTKALTGYNSPVDEAVKDAVRLILNRMLQEEPWASKIKAAVTAALEARVTAESLEKIASDTATRIERAVQDRY